MLCALHKLHRSPTVQELSLLGRVEHSAATPTKGCCADWIAMKRYIALTVPICRPMSGDHLVIGGIVIVAHNGMLWREALEDCGPRTIHNRRADGSLEGRRVTWGARKEGRVAHRLS
jgi:hypothetical protein